MYTYTSVSSGSGINVLIDNVSGNAIQVVKLDLGSEGSSSPVSGNLPVSQSGTWNINSLSNPVSSYILGTVELETPQSGAFPVSIQNPTLIVDGSLNAAQSGAWSVSASSFQAGTWNINSLATPVSSYILGTPSVSQSGAWNVGVSGNVGITNSSLPVTQSGAWNINSITSPVSSYILGTVTVANSIGNPLYIESSDSPFQVGGSVSALQSGPWSVSVSGTATVAGTVTAAQSGTWNVNAAQSGAWNVGVSGTATVSGNVNITNSSLSVAQSGAWTINRAATGISTILSTEMNSLANNGISSLGSAFTNSRWHKADFELLANWGTNPTAGASVELYIVPAFDDTNYADGSSGFVNSNNYAGSFIVRATTGNQRIVLRNVEIPLGIFKIQARNVTGQTMAASANTIKIKPFSL